MSEIDSGALLVVVPLIVSGAGLIYILTVGIAGAMVRRRRLDRARELEARRREVADTPWSHWLREINEESARKRLDDPTERWRE